MSVYHVYILSNTSKMLYTGVTNNLERRVAEHKRKAIEGFTKQYNLHSLVYFESFGSIRAAIIREKVIKAWRREKKTALIRSMNPQWRDLSAEWFRKKTHNSHSSEAQVAVVIPSPSDEDG